MALNNSKTMTQSCIQQLGNFVIHAKSLITSQNAQTKCSNKMLKQNAQTKCSHKMLTQNHKALMDPGVKSQLRLNAKLGLRKKYLGEQ